MSLREETVRTLKRFDAGTRFSGLPELPKASVLVPLLVKNGRLHTWMTLRSTQLRTNAGEVCFPGGKRDPSDQDEVETALREAEEEVGLRPESVQVVCRLFPIINKTGLLVTPVVGFVDESFSPRLNPAEVSAAFRVPLDFFTNKHRLSGSTRTVPAFNFTDPDSGHRYHIWGLTAVMATLVASLALRKNPESDVVFDLEDPISFFQQVLERRISKL